MLAFVKKICRHANLIFVQFWILFKCYPQMSGMKSLVYDNFLT